MRPKSLPDVNLHFERAGWTLRQGALLALLMACGLIVVGQLYATIPLTGTIAARFGVSPAQAALVGAAFGVAYAAGFVLLGSASDRLGRKQAIMAALTATALATAWVAVVDRFEMLLVARAAQGMAASLFAPAALALVTEDLPPPCRPLGVSLMSLAFLGAAPTAQLVAAEVGALGPLMLGVAPLYLAGAAGLLFVAPRTARPVGARAGGRFGDLLRDRGVAAAWGAAATVLFGWVCFYAGAQALGARDGIDPQVLRLSGLPPLLLTLAAAPLTRRRGGVVTARLGLVLAAAGLVLAAAGLILAAAGLAPSKGGAPAMMMAASAVIASGVAFATPGLIAIVAGRASPSNRGLALALYSFALFFGASCAPPFAQALAGANPVALWLAPAVLLLAAAFAIGAGQPDRAPR